jgi:site-specific recombinase
MTASTIASIFNLGGTGSKEKREAMESLADLTVNVFRTQFIAIVGNIMVVFPLAYLLGVFVNEHAGRHLASPEKAQHMVGDLSIIHSPANYHAASAGVFLFLSGLISGYYDNKAVYNRIPERIRQLRWLQRLLGAERLRRMTAYLEDNLGALAGNFFFGIFLGSTAGLGIILGLPLDIRHVTFSTANFAYALVALNNDLPWQVLAMSVIGIITIGLTNLLVSFGLALMVALKAQRVQYRQWVPLAVLIGRRFLKNPLQFFWPPKAAADNTDVVKLA